MPAIEVRPGIYWIGVNDRTTDLFEGLWPIATEGVSYNAYLVKGEKTALIDLSKAFKTDEFLQQIAEVTDVSRLDYIVVNHLEPDHTGVLPVFCRLAQKCTIMGTPKAKEMLAGWYGLTENVRAVSDGETLDLGGRTLRFLHTPFVHWPETMMTLETSEQVLFSCDGFGGYGAFQGAIFDDQCPDLAFYEREALRYYATILTTFSRMVTRAIDKLCGTPLRVIAPSHGLVWRQNPGRIVELYRQWAALAGTAGEPAVTLIYGSSYGNTEKMANAVAEGISAAGVPVQMFDLTRTHAAYILPSLWTRAGVMIGAPTYEGNLFPPAAAVLDLAARKHVQNKQAAWFGSHGWSGGALVEVRRLLEPLEWTLGDTLEFRGPPKAEDLRAGREFGARFAANLRPK